MAWTQEKGVGWKRPQYIGGVWSCRGECNCPQKSLRRMKWMNGRRGPWKADQEGTTKEVRGINQKKSDCASQGKEDLQERIMTSVQCPQKIPSESGKCALHLAVRKDMLLDQGVPARGMQRAKVMPQWLKSKQWERKWGKNRWGEFFWLSSEWKPKAH